MLSPSLAGFRVMVARISRRVANLVDIGFTLVCSRFDECPRLIDGNILDLSLGVDHAEWNQHIVAS